MSTRTNGVSRGSRRWISDSERRTGGTTPDHWVQSDCDKMYDPPGTRRRQFKGGNRRRTYWVFRRAGRVRLRQSKKTGGSTIPTKNTHSSLWFKNITIHYVYTPPQCKSRVLSLLVFFSLCRRPLRLWRRRAFTSGLLIDLLLIRFGESTFLVEEFSWLKDCSLSRHHPLGPNEHETGTHGNDSQLQHFVRLPPDQEVSLLLPYSLNVLSD